MKRIQWAGLAAIFILGACAQLAGIEPPIDPPPEGTSGTGSGSGSGSGGGLQNGSVCSDDAQCASQHCADGVCCNMACTETCKTCNLMGSVGSCINVPAYADDENAMTMCSGTTQSCDGQGICRREIGQPCATKNDCLGAECLNQVCTPRSCEQLTPNCGPLEDEHCCASIVVPGGTYNRSNDPNAPASVSSFRLDRFEVTVGRFRKFVNGYPANAMLAAGVGQHPLIPGSGWDPSWDSSLPANATALKAELLCDPDFQTWTDTAGGNERLPMNCLSWHVAFAFCTWDGGRLPTESEWNYAAAGGDEQRHYPWSQPPISEAISSDYAVYDCMASTNMCTIDDILKVGSKSPLGDAKWQQADLAGSVWEWTLDLDQPYMSECVDCANIGTGTTRIIRGGGWYPKANEQFTSYRKGQAPGQAPDPKNQPGVGLRCARNL